MKTAVIYARQSFGVEEGSVSLEVQIDACKRWAEKNNVNVVGIYQDANTSSELYPYCTEGIEAAQSDRGFKRWKAEQLTKGRKEYKFELGKCFDTIKQSKPDYLCVYTENRLGRSATNSNLKNFLTAYLMDFNCSLVDVQSNSVTDFSDSMMIAFRMMKDALDFHGLHEKRKASMESIARRRNRYEAWSNAYGVIMQKQQVTFDEKKAEAIKFVFDSVLEGASYNGILKALNEEYRGLADGKQWYTTNIYHILNNCIYAGYSRNTEKEIGKAINIPEPIISYSQWQQVQRLVSERKEKTPKYNSRGEGKHWLPFSGLFYCECGRRLQVKMDRGINYQCINPNEHTMWIRIDDNFINSIQSLFMISAIEAERELFNLRNTKNESDSIRLKINSAETSLKAKMRLIETDDDYEMFREEIQAKKAEIKALKAQLLESEAKQSENLDDLSAKVLADFQAISSGETLDKITYQRLLARTIEKITVRKDSISILLKDGNAFDLPRIMLDKRGRKVLPESKICVYVNVKGLHTVYITFGDGEEFEEVKGQGYIIKVAK